MSGRERPILFSGPMVRAILDGTKTQTRRVVKRPRIISDDECYDMAGCWTDADGSVWGAEDALHMCPYGQPGDRLWVRETWAVRKGWDAVPPRDLDRPYVWYRASYQGRMHITDLGMRGRWRPSIHMPRWASRITLEVTDVRVERVQEITEADARAEGITSTHLPLATAHGANVYHVAGEYPTDAVSGTALGAFRDLWDEINAARGYGWDENPWVWVVGFRRIDA